MLEPGRRREPGGLPATQLFRRPARSLDRRHGLAPVQAAARGLPRAQAPGQSLRHIARRLLVRADGSRDLVGLARVDPLHCPRRPRVQILALTRRQPVVEDAPQDGVVEAVILARPEPAVREHATVQGLFEEALDLNFRAPRHARQGRDTELIAEHGRFLDDLAHRRREPVELGLRRHDDGLRQAEVLDPAPGPARHRAPPN